jgi:1,4-dihydroxy-2-naphthoyl-CoA hydrolase
VTAEKPAVSLPADFDLTDTLAGVLGIKLLEASTQRVVGTMPVKGNTQPYGLLHGGASCALAETLGSVGSALHGATLGKIAVGVDINATHHRGARDGIVTGVATPIHLGRTTTSYEIVIADEQERRLCTARLTCQLIPAPKES